MWRLLGYAVTKKLDHNTSYFYDKMDRIVRVVDHNGNVTLYSYDALGNRESLTYANGIKVKYKYDINSLLSGIDIVDAKTNIIKSYVYKRDENGYPVSIEEKDAYGTVKIEYEYDSCNRLSYEKHDNGEGYISYQYSYDNAGNRKTVLIEKHGNISGLTDNAESLKIGVISYSYDENNKLLKTEHNEEITYYSYDERENLISIESPDGIESFEYNSYNELESVKDKSGKVTKYSYDAEGNRISKTCQNNIVKYVTSDFNGLSYVVLELSKDNNNGDDYSNNANNYSDNVNGYSNEEYSVNSGNYDSYKDLKLNKYYTLATELIGFEADGKDYSYILNGHEDVTFVTDKAGKIVNEYSYDSYGNPLISREEVKNCFRYNGQCYDTESGLYYLRARYMDSATGRFTQEDTYQGNLYDPATLHKYSYANDNPVVYCDPSGYSGEFISAIGAVSISVLISGTLCGSLSFVSALALGKKDLLKAFIEGFLIGAALTETGLFLEALGFMSMLEYTAILSVVSFSIEAPQAIMSFAKGQISEGMVHTTYASLSAYGFCKSFGLLSNSEITSSGKISEYANSVKDRGLLEEENGPKAKGWKVGEPINNLTIKGNYPSWSTVKARYWKNKAYYYPDDYSEADLARMRNGNAPLHPKYKVPMELHHKNGRKISDPHNEDNLEELWPWEHDAKDKFRHYKGPRPEGE